MGDIHKMWYVDSGSSSGDGSNPPSRSCTANSDFCFRLDIKGDPLDWERVRCCPKLTRQDPKAVHSITQVQVSSSYPHNASKVLQHEPSTSGQGVTN